MYELSDLRSNERASWGDHSVLRHANSLVAQKRSLLRATKAQRASKGAITSRGLGRPNNNRNQLGRRERPGPPRLREAGRGQATCCGIRVFPLQPPSSFTAHFGRAPPIKAGSGKRGKINRGWIDGGSLVNGQLGREEEMTNVGPCGRSWFLVHGSQFPVYRIDQPWLRRSEA